MKVDDYDHTSPVGSFAANQFGLCDLGGNVWECCGDFYDEQDGQRVLRGASCYNNSAAHLLSSHRNGYQSDGRLDSIGFRCVLAGLASLQPGSHST